MRRVERDAEGYRAALESLYGDVEALDTTGYRWAASDRWRQARLADGEEEHLRVSIRATGQAEVSGSELSWGMSATYDVRWIPEDRAMSEARAMASARDLWLYLLTWSHLGMRATPGRIAIEPTDTERATVTVDFTLSDPWRP